MKTAQCLTEAQYDEVVRLQKQARSLRARSKDDGLTLADKRTLIEAAKQSSELALKIGQGE